MPVWVRAIVFTLLVPGTVAGVVPALIARATNASVRGWLSPWTITGLAVGGAGLTLYLWTTTLFVMRGLGTPAPWDAPRRLVTTGPYAVSRNPMYAGVLGIIAAWAITLCSPWLAAYWCVVVAAFFERTVRYEEPVLARQFGPEFEAYKRRVGRFIGISRNRRDQA